MIDRIGNACSEFWLKGAMTLPEPYLLAWARAQRLLALLSWRAQQKGWELPSSLAYAARDARYYVQAQHMLAEGQLHALGALAESLDIPVVLVKGASVARTYPEPWMRPYTDIDLLVPEARLSDWLTALTTADYTWSETTIGQRGWHAPPLIPTSTGLKVEVHTALARERETALFTLEQWRAGLHPWEAIVGLLLPDPVDHALYIIHHAVVHHELTLGMLPFADLHFWTQAWEMAAWQKLADSAASVGLCRAVDLALALTAWIWNMTWSPEIQQLFPSPPDEILAMAQHSVIGVDGQRMPNVWRDVPERNPRGILKYLTLILLGDPATRRALPWQERARFYLRRPVQLWRNHSPTLWRLVRGERRTRSAWQAQRRLQTWLQDRNDTGTAGETF